MRVKDDQIVKGFDPVILRRLSRYVKPYAVTVVIAMAALLIATAADLATPVILQRTIDRNIMTGYILYRTENAGEESAKAAIAKVLEKKGNIRSADDWFIPHQNFGVISAAQKSDLHKAGVIGEEEWYLLGRSSLVSGEEYSPDPETAAAVESRPDLFVDLHDLTGGNGTAIRKSDLDELDLRGLKAIRSQDRDGIRRYVRLFLLLIVSSLLFTFVQVYLMAVTGQNVMRDVRLKLLDHLIRQSLAYLQKTPVGSLVSRLTSDVDTINELFTSVAISFIKDFAIMIGVIVTLFFLNTRLAVITVCTLPPILAATVFFRMKAREVYRRVRMWVSRVNAFLSEHISGMDVVQMFGREHLSRDEFGENNSGLMKAQLAEMYVFAAFRPLIDLFTSVSIAAVLYFGASMYVESTVSLGILFAFVNLIQMFYRPVMDLSEKFTIMQSAMAGGERIFDILDNETVIPDRDAPAGPDGIKGDISFSNVDFAYNPEEPVLKKLSFDIAAGETVAIVGYTGAGKTTIANLLTRFWDIGGGDILIDGRSVKDIGLSSLRRMIIPVQQDVFLFSGSVADNIALGSGISREAVMDAARTVHAHGFIENLPEGYDTEVKERGSNLSTGQKQLISFARVIAHDPRIIILDEATGSIDTETEKLVQDALQVLLKGRTSIVIAHRLSTIQHADRIFALSGGQLAEQGSHEQLLKKRGLYYNLYKLQYQQGG